MLNVLRFIITFVICLLLIGALLGALAFSARLAEGMSGFGGPNKGGPGLSFYRYPFREDNGNTMILNCVVWAVCISLFIASLITVVFKYVSDRRERLVRKPRSFEQQ